MKRWDIVIRSNKKVNQEIVNQALKFRHSQILNICSSNKTGTKNGRKLSKVLGSLQNSI